MVVNEITFKRVIIVRLNPGDKILESLRAVVKEKGITDGIIINGLGSAQSFNYHVVASNNLPPLESFTASGEPRDIVNISGLIIDGRPHVHIAFSDRNKMEGGHLEEDSKVLTFAFVYIAEIDGDSLTGWDDIKSL